MVGSRYCEQRLWWEAGMGEQRLWWKADIVNSGYGGKQILRAAVMLGSRYGGQRLW